MPPREILINALSVGHGGSTRYIKHLLAELNRDGFAGFVIAVLGALYVFLKEAKLWERSRLRERGLDPDAMPRYSRGPEYRPPRTGAP